MNNENYKRWKELSNKVDGGIATDDEYQEMLNLEWEAEEEDLTYMAQYGM